MSHNRVYGLLAKALIALAVAAIAMVITAALLGHSYATLTMSARNHRLLFLAVAVLSFVGTMWRLRVSAEKDYYPHDEP